MINVNVDIDMSDFRKYMHAATDPHRYFNQAMTKFAEKATIQLKAFTPKDSGKTADGWKPSYIKNADGRIRQVLIHNLEASQDVLTFLEYGTKVHPIEVGSKGYLAWFSKENGKWHFSTKTINHPGTKPYRMVRKTVSLLGADLKQFTTLYEATFQRYLEGQK